MNDAYIITSQDETKINWQKTDDQLKILNADQVIFANDFDDAIQKIEMAHPVNNNDYLKYPLLFDRIESSSYSDSIQILIEPKFEINIRKLNRSSITYLEQFAEFIKDIGTFSYKNHPSEQQTWNTRFHHLKKQLNEHNIYIRPTRKELEYNPKLAAKQLKLIKEKKLSPAFTLSYDANNLVHELSQIISYFTLFQIQKSFNFNNTIKDNFAYCVLLIDIIKKVTIPPTCYRQLSAFQKIKSIWKTIPDKQRDKVASNFCKFMDNEINKRKPKQIKNVAHNLNCKTNYKFFKLYFTE